MVEFIRDLQMEETEILTESTKDGKKSMYIHGIFMQADRKNANGRIYPKAVMEQAVDIFNKDLVSKNRAMGELNHPCFKYGAKVFVVGKGLVPIDQVIAGDYVYGTDPYNKTAATKVINTTKTAYTGKLYHFAGDHFSATTTPYHRWYLKNPNGGFDVHTTKEIADLQEHGLLKLHTIPLTIHQWQGAIKKTFTIPDATNPLNMSFLQYAAFIGTFLSDDRNEVIGDEIHIYRRLDTELQDSIFELTDIDFETISVLDDKITITDYRMALLLDGELANGRKVPNSILESGIEALQVLLAEFQGHFSNKILVSVHEELIDSIAEVALKCRCSAIKSELSSGIHHQTVNGKVIPLETTSDRFSLSLVNGKSIGLAKQALTITEEDYDDFVYCLVTDTGNFYAEQDGTFFLTGNCRLNVDPAEACHLITELKWDGSNVLGKARILEGTPKGGVLKGLVEGGVCMGVSSRAAGSVKKNKQGINEVQNDLRLSTVDAVSDPSAPDAFVQGLMEGVSWIYQNGVFIQDNGQRIEKAIKAIKKAPSAQLDEAKLRVFNEFLNSIK